MRNAGFSFGSGRAGDINLSAEQLRVLNGGQFSSPAFGIGNGGNIAINSNNAVEVIGSIPGIFQSSAIGAASLNQGNGGSLIINTSRLVVRDGGVISPSGLASGNAGSLTINATDSVEVTGRAVGGGLPSRIESAAIIESEPVRQLLGLPDAPSGNSGSVTINTPRLTSPTVPESAPPTKARAPQAT
ncbi:hypothetical protein [Floridanema evergladense]|uniref:Filamentous hemagglutinin n=1 Tax=Floridaenema evergladense BLCC-F167 TaxID=3153639 RepID=A0ABV4WN26_9CYAN